MTIIKNNNEKKNVKKGLRKNVVSLRLDFYNQRSKTKSWVNEIKVLCVCLVQRRW